MNESERMKMINESDKERRKMMNVSDKIEDTSLKKKKIDK